MRGHRRRQGWLAWHVAMLGRMDGKDFPALEEMTGDALHERPEPTPEDQIHALRMWNAVMKGPAHG